MPLQFPQDTLLKMYAEQIAQSRNLNFPQGGGGGGMFGPGGTGETRGPNAMEQLGPGIGRALVNTYINPRLESVKADYEMKNNPVLLRKQAELIFKMNASKEGGLPQEVLDSPEVQGRLEELSSKVDTRDFFFRRPDGKMGINTWTSTEDASKIASTENTKATTEGTKEETISRRAENTPENLASKAKNNAGVARYNEELAKDKEYGNTKEVRDTDLNYKKALTNSANRKPEDMAAREASREARFYSNQEHATALQHNKTVAAAIKEINKVPVNSIDSYNKKLNSLTGVYKELEANTVDQYINPITGQPEIVPGHEANKKTVRDGLGNVINEATLLTERAYRERSSSWGTSTLSNDAISKISGLFILIRLVIVLEVERIRLIL
jgi:hypothetical protein